MLVYEVGPSQVAGAGDTQNSMSLLFFYAIAAARLCSADFVAQFVARGLMECIIYSNHDSLKVAARGLKIGGEVDIETIESL